MSPLPHLNPRIGFVGTKDASPKVSFSGAVAMEYFGTGEFGECNYVACDDFKGVYEALHAGEIDYFVLPTFNKIQGSVKENSLFLTMSSEAFPAEYEQTVQPVYFHGMAKKYINLVLMGLPGATIEGATHVITIPPARNQCKEKLEPLGLEFISEGNTGKSAKRVAEQKDIKFLAIAASEAAKEYGLVELDNDFADKINGEPNHTLFMIGSLEPPQLLDEDENSEQVLYVGLKNEPQNLYKVLKLIANLGINMLRINSLYDHEKKLDQVRCVLQTSLVSNQMQQLIKDLITLEQPFHVIEDLHNDKYYIPADEAGKDNAEHKHKLTFTVKGAGDLAEGLALVDSNITHIESYTDNKDEVTKISCKFDKSADFEKLLRSHDNLTTKQNRVVKLEPCF